jgi:predicted secreted hydrolase
MKFIKINRTTLVFFCFILFHFTSFASQNWKTYPYHQDGSVLNFPDDEGWHPSENVEWWYTVAHVKGDSTGKEYSFMLTYFYYPYYGFDGFRIFNLADDSSGKFYTEMKPCIYDNISKDYLDIKASVFGGDLEEWTTLKDSTAKLTPFRYHLAAISSDGSIDVYYNSLKRPLMVGGTGFLFQGKYGYSYYYSQTKLDVKGVITLNGISENISGTSWIDKQWGQINPSEGEKYEWFCVQLSNDMDLIFYNIFTDNNKIPDTSNYRMCSIYINDSTDIMTTEFELKRLKYSYMPESGNCYSQKWSFKYENIDLIITTVHNNSEVLLPFEFFEGSTTVEGKVNDVPVTGVGFAELLHTYEKPDIKLIAPKGEVEWSEAKPVIWQVNNPDEGRPLYYDIEIIPKDSLTQILRERKLKDTVYYWNTTGYGLDTELNIKITAYSCDSLLTGTAESENPIKIIATGVDDNIKEFTGINIYPNPVSGKSAIKFELRKPEIVNIKIIDMFGRETFTLIDTKFFNIGQHSIDFDAGKLSTGVYFCTLKAGGYVETVKMVIIR